MVESEKVIIALLILAIVFSVLSVIVSYSALSHTFSEIGESKYTGSAISGKGYSGIELYVEGTGEENG